MSQVWRCGLCDINFKSKGEMRRHFDSDKEHKKKLSDPDFMAKKILESQLSIYKSMMLGETEAAKKEADDGGKD